MYCGHVVCLALLGYVKWVVQAVLPLLIRSPEAAFDALPTTDAHPATHCIFHARWISEV